ncbi:UPF0462 protein C4orf33 homolog [Ostrea edulis]|uniref:UPF0462 protein C4orf33 homolog n=1 Tax=Ostrea edulis TaxID=37623 RepID=UPI0024AFFA2E|nr:UPF0462 protein C4orf33 homolog [Ostrea edulis]XP_056011505.1 UPF0462 protein C4orf33 homolog [Ostrea edulis]
MTSAYSCWVVLSIIVWISVSIKAYSIPVAITKTWNNLDVNHPPVRLVLAKATGGLEIRVNAPFFNDPSNPGGQPGQPFNGLWDYEVAEAFFLNDRNQYIEIELCPHGQHLVLLLKGYRDSFASQLPMQFSSSINNDTWTGTAFVPDSYFPPKITKFNAYAIHGSGTGRTYEALYPTPNGKYTDPDFHRLEYFHAINFRNLVPENWAPTYSSTEWDQTLLG